MRRLPDIEAGAVYGRLTVTGKADRPGRYSACRCECGNTSVVQDSVLRNGLSRSCGCGRINSNGQIKGPGRTGC